MADPPQSLVQGGDDGTTLARCTACQVKAGLAVASRLAPPTPSTQEVTARRLQQHS